MVRSCGFKVGQLNGSALEVDGRLLHFVLLRNNRRMKSIRRAGDSAGQGFLPGCVEGSTTVRFDIGGFLTGGSLK